MINWVSEKLNFSTEFQWQLNWKILVFVAVFLPVTTLLGFWQLDRAEGKREILSAQEQQQNLVALTNTDWQQDKANHLRRVDLAVNMDSDRYLLLANRTINSQVGYEVISLAQVINDQPKPQLILVNRGWVPASLNRDELPEVSDSFGRWQIQGYYYCPEANSMISQSTDFDGIWPAIIYSLDESAMQQIFADPEQRPLACEIRLDQLSPLALLAQWQIVNQSVEKHIGYAVQWFLMAFALIILALFSNSNLGKFFSKGSRA